MSKLTRVLAALFGSTAAADEIAQFGSLAASAPLFSTNPAEIQGLDNFKEGWFGAVMGDNSPTIEDMNGLFFVLFYQIAYFFQQGIPEWSDSATYYIGSLVQDGFGNTFISIQNENTNQSIYSASWWTMINGSVTIATSDYNVLLSDDLIITGGGGVININLPTPGFASGVAQGKRYTIKKGDSGTNYVNIVPPGGYTIQDGSPASTLVNQYDTITLEYRGSVVWSVISKSLVPSIGISSSCSNFSDTSGSFVAVSNLSVQIIATGNPVEIRLVSDGSSNQSNIGSSNGAAADTYFQIQILEGSTIIARIHLESNPAGSSSDLILFPVSSISHIYQPVAGTYTYTVKVSSAGSGKSVVVNYAKLVVRELK